MFANKLIIMEKSVLLFIVLFAFISCTTNKNLNTFQSCGNVEKVISDSLSFNKLEVSCDCDIILNSSQKGYYQIKTGDQFIANIKISTNNNSLIISQSPKFIRFKNNEKCKCEITIGINSINSFSLSGVGNVSASNIIDFTNTKKGIINRIGIIKLNMKTEIMDLEFNNVGQIKLEGTADALKVLNNSNGGFDGGKLIIHKLDLQNNGVGDITINVLDEISVKSSGVGKLNIFGNPIIKSFQAVNIIE
jgi:hypothetical protein